MFALHDDTVVRARSFATGSRRMMSFLLRMFARSLLLAHAEVSHRTAANSNGWLNLSPVSRAPEDSLTAQIVFVTIGNMRASSLRTLTI
ncbi:hypothetical protein Xclt_19440 [Xanthomonas axonopodis pv. clitoriae]|uniref:Secreted protein n=1 Tax=Xanthomonas axonopodis pv. clitoriae TaxID=487828 RepID=A0AB73NA41_9XANT|nr:hypothetical protein Xclt_19440 [Xanthomonas axonopodis pv. clitoriae]